MSLAPLVSNLYLARVDLALAPSISAFSSYGAFWMSFATILIPASGVVDSYAKGPPEELTNALGIYLITWGMFTFLMM